MFVRLKLYGHIKIYIINLYLSCFNNAYFKDTK